MTDDPAADSARAAAVILAPSHGAALPTQVEAVLAARHSVQRPGSFLDPVSLASLIVAIAALAWTVYNDQRSHTTAPPPETIARQVRITLREQEATLPPDVEQITEIIATEIIRHANPPAKLAGIVAYGAARRRRALSSQSSDRWHRHQIQYSCNYRLYR